MPPYRRRNLAVNSRSAPDRSRHPFPRPPPAGLTGPPRHPPAAAGRNLRKPCRAPPPPVASRPAVCYNNPQPPRWGLV